MGLGMAAVKLNLDLWRQGLFKNVDSVIEMGSQELHLKLSDFEELVRMAGVSHYRREDFLALNNWPGVPRCPSRHFYALLGIKNYSCVDLNKVYGAIPLDFNRPLEDKSLYDKYDMVTDHGANEHAFNVAEAYRTMHRLCKPGGILTIFQVLYGGNGYYLFDYPFFEGLAAANNYRILFSSYIVTTPGMTSSGSDNQFHLPLSRELLGMLDWSKTRQIAICYVLQKESNKDFCYPYQNEFLSEIQRHYGFELQYLQSPPSRAYVPMYALNTIRGKALLSEASRRITRKIKSSLGLK